MLVQIIPLTSPRIAQVASGLNQNISPAYFLASRHALWAGLPRGSPQVGAEHMARNTGNLLNLEASLGGDATPLRKRRLADTKLARQPGHQTALAADEIHPDHAGTMAHANISMQGDNVSPANADLDDDCSVEIAKIIREARLRLKLKQADVARRMGIQQSTISHWESGRYRPKTAEMLTLASILHLSPLDLMPDGDFIPEQVLRDPQVRRLVSNFLKLSPEERSAFDLLLQRSAERATGDD